MALDDKPLDPAALPRMLAGPILRQLTRNSVTVWAALSSGGEVTLDVRPSGAGDFAPISSAKPVRVGRSLWLLALTGSPNGDGFLPHVTYEYRLTFREPVADHIDWTMWSYDGLEYPSIVGLPEKLEDFNLYHTSCRKPHGGGRDGLAQIDGIIAQAIGQGDATRRPHLLLLTGDQIYADDVGAPLVPRIRRLAADLVGTRETDVFTKLADPNARERKVGGRQVTSKQIGLSSELADNHLWTLGEFFSMYLLAWSESLWPTSLPTWAQAEAAGDIAAPPQGESVRLTSAVWDKQREALVTFRDGLAAARRLLANVPTLMMFDDHEVTDDWNLDYQWVSRVYANPAARRVVANGLIAYSLCQHWGNRPNRFTSPGEPESKILSAAEWNPNISGPANRSTLETVLGVPMPPIPEPPTELGGLGASVAQFAYALGPSEGFPFRIIVLDERTTRALPTRDGPAGRISSSALERVFPPGPPPDNVPLILVAPSPVIGVRLLEYFLQPASALLPGGAEFSDFETWAADDAAFGRLLRRIASYKQAVILSGDVHYGGTVRLVIEDPAGTAKAHVAQFTSSAAKNADPLTLVLHAFGDLTHRVGAIRPRIFDGFEALPEDERAKLRDPPQGVLPLDDVADVLLGRTLRAGTRHPAVFPSEISRAYRLPTPDWRYNVEHIDEEALPSDPSALRAIRDAPTKWSGWIPDRSILMLRALRAADLHRIGRVFVGLPQVGQVGFTRQSGRLIAHQRLASPIGGTPPPGGRPSDVSIKVIVPLA